MLDFFKHLGHNNKSHSQVNLIKRQSLTHITKKINTINNFYLDNQYLIFYPKYSVVDKLYESSNKAIYIVKSNEDNKKYTLKLYSSNSQKKEHQQVFDILKANNSEHIINFIEFVEKNNYYYIVYEYFDGITLLDYIKFYEYNLDDIQHILQQLLEGVDHLHKNNIIHCDIKPENIIISMIKKVDALCNNVSIYFPQIKIIDFDLAKFTDDILLLDGSIGTQNYISPESHDLHIYSHKSDIWAVGIVLYMLVTKKNPISYDTCNLYKRNTFKHIDFTELKMNGDECICDIAMMMLEFHYKYRCDIDSLMTYL